MCGISLKYEMYKIEILWNKVTNLPVSPTVKPYVWNGITELYSGPIAKITLTDPKANQLVIKHSVIISDFFK